MSSDRIDITVTCPADKCRAVATQITRDTGYSTRLRDAHGELITVRAAGGTLSTLETVEASSVIRSEAIPVSEGRPRNGNRDAGADAEDKLTRGSAVEHSGLQPNAGADPMTGVDNRPRNPHGMFWHYRKAMARVVHHIGRLPNRWIEVRHNSSPSLDGLNNPSVGDGSASGDEHRDHTSDADHPDGGGA